MSLGGLDLEQLIATVADSLAPRLADELAPPHRRRAGPARGALPDGRRGGPVSARRLEARAVSPVPETGAAARNGATGARSSPEPLADRLLIADEAAELLALPVSWVREATRQGTLPHVKLGRYRRYVRTDLEAWVETQKAGAPSR